MNVKRLHLLLLSLGMGLQEFAQLTAGDIAFLHVNADSPKDFSWVALVDIAAGEEFFFTEDGWNGTEFYPAITEAHILFTAPGGGISAGTVVTISEDAVTPNTFNCSTGSAVLASAGTDTWDFSTAGDQILAYEGTVNNPTQFIAGITVDYNGSAYDPSTMWATTGLSNITSSALPPGLTNGTNAIAVINANNYGSVGELDNNRYTCTLTSGTKSQLLAAINDYSNWEGHNTTTYSPCVASFTVLPDGTTWNGTTWSAGAPNSTTDATISGSAAPGSFTCANLTIDNGVSLTVSGTVTIVGDVTNNGNGFAGTGTVSFDDNGGSVTLSGNAITFGGIVNVTSGTTLNTAGLLTLTASSASSYGQLLNSGTVNGNVIQQAWVAGSSARYYQLGTPLSGVTFDDLPESGNTIVSAANSTGSVWQWNASTAEWENPGATSGSMTRGRGYAIYAGATAWANYIRTTDGAISVTGTDPGTSNLDVTLGYNDGSASSVTFVDAGNKQGWNLLSNPWPTQYDIDGQSFPSGASAVVHVWNGTNYQTYNTATQAATNGGIRYLAPFQGFFVQLASDNGAYTFTFDNTDRTSGQSSDLEKTTTALPGFRLTATDGAGHADETLIYFDGPATEAWDLIYDGPKLYNEVGIPNLYSFADGKQAAMNGLPMTFEGSVPLGFTGATNAQTYTFTGSEETPAPSNYVFLEDKKEGVMVDIRYAPYTFNYDENWKDNRFELHFAPQFIGLEESGAYNWWSYRKGDQLIVELPGLANATVEVRDLQGRLLHTSEGGAERRQFHLPVAGLYLVTVREKDLVQTAKVF